MGAVFGAVLVRIGQRLLDDPIRDLPCGARHRGQIALGPQPDVQTHGSERAHDLIKPAQIGLRGGGRVVVIGAQHLQESADLAQDGARRMADGGERLLCLVRTGVDRGGGDPRLEADDRDLVRDRVVQVASDPESLFADPPLCFRLAGLLGPFCPFGHGLDVLPPRASGLAEGAPHGDGQRELHHLRIPPVAGHQRDDNDDDEGAHAHDHADPAGRPIGHPEHSDRHPEGEPRRDLA